MTRYIALGVMVLALLGCSSTAESAPAQAPEEEPVPVTGANELSGLWLRPGSQHAAYIRFEADGRYLMAFERENLPDAPDASGRFWFEEGRFYIEDLAYSQLLQDDPGSRCSGNIGVYEVAREGDDKLLFTMVDDSCEARVRSLSTVLGLARLE